MKRRETVTILTSTKNQTPYLKNCIESVQNQDYQGRIIHIILVDNCIETANFLRRNYQFSDNLMWFEVVQSDSKKDKLARRADLFNRLIWFAYTPWISFLNVNTQCNTNHISSLIQAINRKNSLIAKTSCKSEKHQIVDTCIDAYLFSRALLNNFSLYSKYYNQPWTYSITYEEKLIQEFVQNRVNIAETQVVTIECHSRQKVMCRDQNNKGIYETDISFIKPKEKDITFFVNVHKDTELLNVCLEQLRKIYQNAHLIIRSDGDKDPEIAQLANKYKGLCFYQDNLMGIENGGAIVHEMLALFLEHTPSRYLFKIDPDTRIVRPFKKLPDSPCMFGTVQHQESLFSLQGGCMGITREIAEELCISKYFLNPDFAKVPPVWAINKILENRPRKGWTSFDWLIGWACREKKIALIDWPEICSEWLNTPDNQEEQYAVTHPHKIL